jgi:membrane protein DedA with SNARE-associated domain
MVFFQIRYVNWESAMAYMMDVPTLAFALILKRIFPGMGSVSSGHPYYFAFNLLGVVVWGVLFALCAWSISAVVTARRARLNRSRYLARQQ